MLILFMLCGTFQGGLFSVVSVVYEIRNCLLHGLDAWVLCGNKAKVIPCIFCTDTREELEVQPKPIRNSALE